ncbi:hypothetical protein [Massilia sp. GCM10023247]|uniref:hypothetical protein n=1 Tax=Massilia sp. GCM10023247 TaxID=3252643 RepID=UPI0036D260FF
MTAPGNAGGLRSKLRGGPRSIARRAARSLALRTVGFIIARPHLDAFLRRQIFRFPGLAGRVRAALARSRRANWQSLPPVMTDEADLTDGARQVLRDLQRAAARSCQP